MVLTIKDQNEMIKKKQLFIWFYKGSSSIFATAFEKHKFINFLEKRRGAGVVAEQIANLSTGNRRQGSNPCLSAFF